MSQTRGFISRLIMLQLVLMFIFFKHTIRLLLMNEQIQS